MTSYNYFIGFAASQANPTDRIAIVEVTVSIPMNANTRHELFVDALTDWVRDTSEGQQLLTQEIDGPVTIGAILAALDSQALSSLDYWLERAGMFGFRVRMSSSVFDLDALLVE